MATRNIVPRANEEGNIGTNLKRWLKGWFKDLFVSNELTDGTKTTTISDIKDAVDDAHSHSNKAELDLVTDGDHDVRTDNPHDIQASQVDYTPPSGSSIEADNVQDAVDELEDEKSPTGHTHTHTAITDKNAETDIKHTTDDQKNALDNANSPDTSNPLATQEDIDHQYNNDETESSTTSTTFQNKLTLTFTPPVAGDYMIEWNLEVSRGGTANQVETQVLHESTQYGFTSGRLTTYLSYSGFFKLSLPASSQNFHIEFRSPAGVTTCYIRRARLLARRVI